MLRRLIYRMFAFLILGVVCGQQAAGQDYPTSLQYITNMQTINPAYAGIWGKSRILFSTKTNWVGINGAPVSQYVNFSTPIKEQKTGLGLSFRHETVGQEKMLFLTGDYSYRLQLSRNHFLQFGLRAGIVNFDNNLNDYQPYPDYIPDPNMVTDIRMQNMTVFGIGVVFSGENDYLSISVPQFISNTFNALQPNFMSSANYKTMYLCGGFVFGRPEKVRFRPNLLLAATIGKPTYADIGAIIYLPRVLQFGINVRTTGLVCLFSQYAVTDRIRIGYALNYSVTSNIRKFQLGTHELLVEYDINIYQRKFRREIYF